MKLLLASFLLLPTFAFAGDTNQDITCALESVHNDYHPGRAGQVVYLRHIGENVFERNHYAARGRAKNYRLQYGDQINRLTSNEDGVYRLSYNLFLTKDLILTENTSGGGYPGAGSPPSRGKMYKCIEGYSFSLDKSKAQVKADFNL